MHLAPMKYSDSTTATAASLLTDNGWVAEQKLDGTRSLVTVRADGAIRFYGHGGRTLAHSAATQHFDALRTFLAPLAALLTGDGTLTVDGEIITGTGELHLFDLAHLTGFVDPVMAFRVRRAALEQIAPLLGKDVHVVGQARGTDSKRDLLAAVEAAGGEGVMLKDLDAPYEPGVRTTRALKVKFVKTADVIVTARNVGPEGTLNAHLAVSDGAGGLVPVGGCSMIGKPDAQVGDVIEVAFLYWTGERLYQPRMVRTRPDKAASDCRLDQFVPYSREILEIAR